MIPKLVGDNKWIRVTGPDLDTKNKERRKANDIVLADSIFLEACKLAGIPSTKRQARKWQKGRGKAYESVHYV